MSPQQHPHGVLRSELAARTGHDLGSPAPANTIAVPKFADLEDGLSEEEAVAMGLWANPAYRELLADLQITHADIIAAAQLQNPQVITMIPVGPKQWEFALSLPLDAICLRPNRVATAELESHRVGERLVQDGLNTVRDIRVAYIDWQTAIERAAIVSKMAELRNEVARVAKARLEAGASSELSVAAIQLDARVGAADANRANREVGILAEQLRYLIGLQASDSDLPRPASTTMPAVSSSAMDINALTLEAVRRRPDLRAVQLAIDAAELRAELAGRNIWQSSVILPDINARGRKGFEAGPGWQLSLPILHQNQGAIAQAQADAERLRQQYHNRKDIIAMEVRQAFLRLRQAEQDLQIWRENIVPQARQTAVTAQAALQEDAVQLLLVLETNRQQLAAQQRELDAKAQFRRAAAELERSVGWRLFDYTEGGSNTPTLLPDSTEDLPADAINAPTVRPKIAPVR